MNERRLQAFLEVARAGSVRGAAERLVVTQPAVTATIRVLEGELGVRLVARAGRGLVLTPSGEVLARYAAQVLGLLAQTRSAVREAAEPGRGRVRLVAVTTAGEYVLPPILKEFRALNPEVGIVLEVGNRRLVWERLRDRGADVAIGGRPPAAGGFTGTPFRRNDLVVVGPASFDVPRRRLSPTDLAAVTWLLREPGSGTRSTAEEWFAETGLSPPALTIGSNGAIVQSVAVGLGVTLISRDAVQREVEAGTVRILPLAGLPLKRNWHVVTRTDKELPGAARLFLDHVLTSAT